MEICFSHPECSCQILLCEFKPSHIQWILSTMLCSSVKNTTFLSINNDNCHWDLFLPILENMYVYNTFFKI